MPIQRIKPNIIVLSIDKVETINYKAGKEGKVELLCIRNTFLPDGTFVGKDSRILVDSDYAERVAQEQNPSFKLI